MNTLKNLIKTDIFKQDDKYQVIMSNDSQAFYVGKPFDTYDEAEIYENNLIKFLSSTYEDEINDNTKIEEFHNKLIDGVSEQVPRKYLNKK